MILRNTPCLNSILVKFLKPGSVLACFCILFVWGCMEEKEDLIRLEIGLTDTLPISVPVSLDIDTGLNNDIVLVEMRNGDSREIPFQVQGDKLWFNLGPQNGASDKAEIFIKKGKSTTDYRELTAVDNNGDLHLIHNDKPVLSYRYGMTYPPKGVDSIFKKSGYIHPLLTPNGDTLTRIQPPDHYHHYGIWGPWTHTRIKDSLVDFWNLGEGMGTVLFKDFKNTTSGNVFTAFDAHQEHFDFKTEKEPQVALNESLHVALWNLGRTDRYMFDYTSTINSPLENGILLEAYRYGGGIGMRFTERWHKDNCTVLTSEGNDRLTADGTNARWCIVSGESADGKGTNGVLFMSHPENRMHPEPMRVWPIDGNNGRGDMFFEFCPIRHEEWNLAPNKDYRLKYRMVVFDGELKPEEAEVYWQTFANPIKVNLSKD